MSAPAVIVLGCYDSAVACPRSRARAELRNWPTCTELAEADAQEARPTTIAEISQGRPLGAKRARRRSARFRWRDRNTAAARHACQRTRTPSWRSQPGPTTRISPRWTSARSYADQFPTWYFVLYFGCTLDFMSRSCACRRYDGQEVERGSPRARATPATAPRSAVAPAE